jgi:predicted 2-oxoglutarate/Fe(II)-dependent dioxygenase YbiX
MSVKPETFIGIYEGAFSQGFCDAAIQYYDNSEAAGYTRTRQKAEPDATKILKDDSVAFLNAEVPAISLYTAINLANHFNDVFWNKYYPEYVDKYFIIADMGTHTNPIVKIQKTEPGQGYHVWHAESMTIESCRRILAWTVYLNDVEEGGETEFLYQHMRVKPKAGTLVIWPASFTHVHRGNPPLSGSKYIITGWIEL